MTDLGLTEEPEKIGTLSDKTTTKILFTTYLNIFSYFLFSLSKYFFLSLHNILK